MKPLAVTMECTNKNKPVSMTKKTPRCGRFHGGDKEDGAFTGEQLRCVRCGKNRGEHRYAGTRDELLPPRKRSLFRRLVQFQVLNEKKREKEPEEGEILTGRAVTKGKRTPRRKLANVVWAGLSESLSSNKSY